jgi:DNA invertase Pin-like site-specific DNA recombinase
LLIGYARVSTEDQSLDLQRRALEAAGCEVIHEDKGFSGAATSRPALTDALSAIKPGDVLVVWRLDRLGRSLAHLIQVIDGLGKIGAGFKSLCESVDTTSPGGRLILHIMGALAEFERQLISERTRAGIAEPPRSPAGGPCPPAS